MLVCREDIAQIRSIKYVFEGRQDLDPDVRSVFSGYEASIEEKK